MPFPTQERVGQFKDCLLNTCVRAARPLFTDGLALTNCRSSEDFCEAAVQWLCMPFFLSPVEPAMEIARQELISELTPYSGAA